jgi:hypothetical protein
MAGLKMNRSRCTAYEEFAQAACPRADVLPPFFSPDQPGRPGSGNLSGAPDMPVDPGRRLLHGGRREGCWK